MKNISDKLFWVVLVLMGVYLLYQKGMIGANFESVSPKVAFEMLQNDDNVTLLDVRSIEEFKKDGKLAGAKLIPLDQLSHNLEMLDRSKKVLVYCRSGNRSVSASRILESNGFTAINMSGGILDWRAEKFPVE
ncbi:rhodanese-like domain-containing protein [bacterium]|nr:rhodanese-like domain-containing protein [bacterium]MBU1957853.1 rhodanese-like domain-containing protein [bacterium]